MANGQHDLTRRLPGFTGRSWRRGASADAVIMHAVPTVAGWAQHLIQHDSSIAVCSANYRTIARASRQRDNISSDQAKREQTKPEEHEDESILRSGWASVGIQRNGERAAVVHLVDLCVRVSHLRHAPSRCAEANKAVSIHGVVSTCYVGVRVVLHLPLPIMECSECSECSKVVRDVAIQSVLRYHGAVCNR